MNDNRNQKPPPLGQGPKGGPGRKPPLPTYRRSPFTWLIIAAVIFTAMMMLQRGLGGGTMSVDAFEEHLTNGDVESVKLSRAKVTGEFKEGLATDAKGRRFTVHYRGDAARERMPRIHKIVADTGNTVTVEYAAQGLWLNMLLTFFMPLVVILVIFYFLYARNAQKPDKVEFISDER
jgi:ATP-dependent Zn protease